MQSRFAGMHWLRGQQPERLQLALRSALLECTGSMEGHTATGKRAYRGHTATGKQNNLAGMLWCPERLALIIFIIIWHQRLLANKKRP